MNDQLSFRSIHHLFNESEMSSPDRVSTASPVTVWYILVDSTTGKTLKGVTVDCISLDASIRTVAQFRHAVKQMNTNKLSTVDAPALLIYKNKEAFDKRQETEDGYGGYLDPRESLDGLGSTTDILVVAVPSPISSDTRKRILIDQTQWFPSEFQVATKKTKLNHENENFDLEIEDDDKDGLANRTIRYFQMTDNPPIWLTM